MAQFDVYAGVGRSNIHVVDLQSDALDQLTTRIVRHWCRELERTLSAS